jgi:two-component system, LuxR family, response regulator FixJ
MIKHLKESSTVFIVDDDSAVRDSLLELVESVGLAGEIFPSAIDFLDNYVEDTPGCLVLDVRMAVMSGLVLQKRLNEMGSRIPLIFISGHGDIPMAVRALKAGAMDFIQKPYKNQQLLDSINLALERDSDRRRVITGSDKLEGSLAKLTAREREVLALILDGISSKDVARKMKISHRTVEAHRQQIYGKLQVHSVAQLMRLMNTHKA